ncbi:MAG: TetR/AcrR family transcriptional regulator [Gammaproteobacteria bacterium]|nr:TetR/AcrR family transcriptional regulator [Gammaproteobacteria bacterium]
MAMNAAKEIVRTEGFRGLTARKIAAAIGYTVGSLYLVFKNLDDLIVQVNEDTMSDLHGSIGAAVNEAESPEKAVYACANAYLDFGHQNPHLWRMVFEHKLPLGQPLHESFKAKVAETFALCARALQPLFGKQSAAIADLSSHALWAGIHGICMLSVTGKLESANVENARLLTDNLIHNYLAGARV